MFQGLARKQLPVGVRIRDTDYMQDTARAFDQALHTMHDSVAQLRQHYEEWWQAASLECWHYWSP